MGSNASVSGAIKVDPAGFKFTSKKYSQLSLFIFWTNKNKDDLAPQESEIAKHLSIENFIIDNFEYLCTVVKYSITQSAILVEQYTKGQ